MHYTGTNRGRGGSANYASGSERSAMTAGRQSQRAKSAEGTTRILVAVLRGEVSIAEAVRRKGVSTVSAAKWRDQFLAGSQQALEGRRLVGALGPRRAAGRAGQAAQRGFGRGPHGATALHREGALYGPSTSSTPSARRRT